MRITHNLHAIVIALRTLYSCSRADTARKEISHIWCLHCRALHMQAGRLGYFYFYLYRIAHTAPRNQVSGSLGLAGSVRTESSLRCPRNLVTVHRHCMKQPFTLMTHIFITTGLLNLLMLTASVDTDSNVSISLSSSLCTTHAVTTYLSTASHESQVADASKSACETRHPARTGKYQIPRLGLKTRMPCQNEHPVHFELIQTNAASPIF